jgi:hypothetical protein
MSDAPQREWRFYIDDMIACAERALSYTEGMDQERFVASGLNYDATIRNLELIGEAATHIPDAVREAHPEVPGGRLSPRATVSSTVIWVSTTTRSGALSRKTRQRCWSR